MTPPLAYREPLSRRAKIGVFASVIFFHAGIGWALASVQPQPLTVGDVASMEVRMVAAEQPPAPEPQIDIPPPDDTPPPEVPQLESMIQPPMPDLPPPEFPVVAPPPKPKPPPPKPQPPRPQPVQHAEPSPAPAQPTQQAATAAPQPLSMFQVTWSVRPVLVYPARARRASQQGTAIVRAFVDASGVPTQVTVEKSTGYPLLDEAAMKAVHDARTNTGGRSFWVTCPFNFELTQ